MAKTYTINASQATGARGSSNGSKYTTFESYANIADYSGWRDRVDVSGRYSNDWFCTSYRFSIPAAYRSKPVTKVEFQFNSTVARSRDVSIFALSSSAGWTKSGSVGSFAASSTGTKTITIGTSASAIPTYGFVMGPYSNADANNSYVICKTGKLIITTSESDYSYALAFNSNGGVGSYANLTGSNTQVSPSYTFTIPSNYSPTRTGYTFSGWATSSSATAGTYSPGGTCTVSASGTTTLYAVWTKNSYTITVKALDPEQSDSNTAALFDVWYSDDATVISDQTSLTVTKKYGDTIYINNVRPYYNYCSVISIDNMVDDGNGQYHYTLDENSSGESLVIHTARNQYTIEYNANGGNSSTVPANQTKYGGIDLTLSSTIPTYEGYTFIRWNTSSDGSGTDYDPASTYSANVAVVLYAQWIASSSTLTLANHEREAGESLMIYINKLSDTATHTLTYVCGNQNGTIVTKTSDYEVVWTVPASFVSEITGQSGTCYISCTTYVNDVQTGVPQTVSLTVVVPGTYQPSVSLSAVKVNSNSTVDNWDILLQGYSQVTLTATATMASGASLVSYSFSGPGVSYLGVNNTVTSEILTTYGTDPWTVTVTDSRGRTATAVWDSASFEIYQYETPSITGASTTRTDATGVSSAGPFLKSKANLNFSSCNGNNAMSVHKVEYREVGGSTWILGDDTMVSRTWTSPYGSGTIDPTLAYEIQYTLSDSLGNAAVITATIAAVVGIGIGLKNDRIRLGGLPTKPGLQVDWDAEFNGVLDVTNRRCSATLSSAGWYRVIHYDSPSGSDSIGAQSFIIELYITRGYATTSNETHKITLNVPYNKITFTDENSVSNVLGIDKIRYTRTPGTGNAYVDIHYNLSTAEVVTVDYSIKIRPDFQQYFTAESMQSVADAPTGETVVTTYPFAAYGSNLRKVIRCDVTLTSGYCIVEDPAISTGSKLVACVRYGSTGYLMNVILICSNYVSGKCVVYVRNTDTTIPANGSKLQFDLLIDNNY